MFIFYFILWIIFNGQFTVEIALFGVAISAAVYAFSCLFMDFSIQKDIQLIKRIGYFLEYAGVLIWEIIKANIVMAKMIVIKQEYELSPVIFSVHTNLKSKTCRVLLANAITLTPGTISIAVEEDELIVHAVDKSLLIEDDGSFVFERLLLKLENGGKK